LPKFPVAYSFDQQKMFDAAKFSVFFPMLDYFSGVAYINER
jgi:hypothetical protein